ncbi:MAG TPA: BlaI/MecI/CopY family transcriptional regulator [Acidobacteriota bacterium]|nr:BlaI/MecI/CopY family transcriptional regulator [Acidobacteriota bacterium]
MKKKSPLNQLSRRERQVMDILYSQGRATASEIHQSLPDPPSYSAVRATLRVLEEKGHVSHQGRPGHAYRYAPTLERGQARRSALHHLVDTFFEGSAEKLVAALLDEEDQMSPQTLDRISRLIEEAREEGR